LIWAVANDQDECAELLVHAKANVEAQDIEGKTALMWAVAYDLTACTKLLVRASPGSSIAIQAQDLEMMTD